jgi:hypothetical protein
MTEIKWQVPGIIEILDHDKQEVQCGAGAAKKVGKAAPHE